MHMTIFISTTIHPTDNVTTTENIEQLGETLRMLGILNSLMRKYLAA